MKKKILIGSIIVVIAVLIGGFVYYLTEIKREKVTEEMERVPAEEREEIILPPGTIKEPNPEAITPIKDLDKESKILPEKIVCNPKEFISPAGKIYLSLRGLTASTTGIYEFDVKKKELKEFLRDDSCDNFVLDFSVDKEKIAFVSNCQSEKPYIAIGKGDKTEIKKLIVSDEKETINVGPVFSPDGKKLAFTKMYFVSDILAESWESFVVDLNGKVEFSTHGVMPLFSLDGRYLLVFKNPGIYKYNLQTGDVERVIELQDKNGNLILGQVNMMLSLSKDGKKLAWSNIDREELYVFEINSWEPFKYKLLAQIKINAFWNSFSPDGKYLAVQETDINERGETINPRLTVFETCSFGELFFYSLKEYDPGEMWVTAWK